MFNYRRTIALTIETLLPPIEGQSPLTIGAIEGLLELPKEMSHGDIAFPCFFMAKALKKPPPLIAKELVERLAAKLPEGVSRVVAMGPYINFYFDTGHIAREITQALQDGEFLARGVARNMRVMVEYSQPNTHKAFHVGHLRNASLGDSLARILQWVGNDVVASNYIGDEGTHIAKCLWYLRRHFKGTVPDTHRGEFLGELYTKATLLLDLASYTRVPFPGVVSASVTSVVTHPKAKEWLVLKLHDGEGERSVVTADTSIKVGEVVAYARKGTRLSERVVGTLEKKGEMSEGMVCSERDLELGESETVLRLASETQLGAELAELFRIPDTLALDRSVLEEHARMEAEVGEVLQKLEGVEPDTIALWRETKEWSMQEFYRIYEWLNCHFDHYFFESECGELGKQLVQEYLKKGIFVKDDGAIGADLSKFGLGFCLLIKRNGTAMYATRDLALARKKFDEFHIDQSIYVVDAAQSLHFQQVFKCLELMGYEQASRCKHLAYGLVVLPDGKMSSRKGNIILFSQLEERLTQKITAEFLEKYRGEWSDEEIATAAHRLALATMRYGMLNQANTSNIVFDLDDWTSRTGNTGPYLMYAYARTRSILRELKGYDSKLAAWSEVTHESEREVLQHLRGYRETVEKAAENSSPSILCGYLYELTKRFNRMYTQCSVMGAPTEGLKHARAALVDVVGQVIAHGLRLLGIPTIERM